MSLFYRSAVTHRLIGGKGGGLFDSDEEEETEAKIPKPEEKDLFASSDDEEEESHKTAQATAVDVENVKSSERESLEFKIGKVQEAISKLESDKGFKKTLDKFEIIVETAKRARTEAMKKDENRPVGAADKWRRDFQQKHSDIIKKVGDFLDKVIQNKHWGNKVGYSFEDIRRVSEPGNTELGNYKSYLSFLMKMNSFVDSWQPLATGERRSIKDDVGDEYGAKKSVYTAMDRKKKSLDEEKEKKTPGKKRRQPKPAGESNRKKKAARGLFDSSDDEEPGRRKNVFPDNWFDKRQIGERMAGILYEKLLADIKQKINNVEDIPKTQNEFEDALRRLIPDANPEELFEKAELALRSVSNDLFNTSTAGKKKQAGAAKSGGSSGPPQHGPSWFPQSDEELAQWKTFIDAACVALKEVANEDLMGYELDSSELEEKRKGYYNPDSKESFKKCLSELLQHRIKKFIMDNKNMDEVDNLKKEAMDLYNWDIKKEAYQEAVFFGPPAVKEILRLVDGMRSAIRAIPESYGEVPDKDNEDSMEKYLHSLCNIYLQLGTKSVKNRLTPESQIEFQKLLENWKPDEGIIPADVISFIEAVTNIAVAPNDPAPEIAAGTAAASTRKQNLAIGAIVTNIVAAYDMSDNKTLQELKDSDTDDPHTQEAIALMSVDHPILVCLPFPGYSDPRAKKNGYEVKYLAKLSTYNVEKKQFGIDLIRMFMDNTGSIMDVSKAATAYPPNTQHKKLQICILNENGAEVKKAWKAFCAAVSDGGDTHQFELYKIFVQAQLATPSVSFVNEDGTDLIIMDDAVRSAQLFSVRVEFDEEQLGESDWKVFEDAQQCMMDYISLIQQKRGKDFRYCYEMEMAGLQTSFEKLMAFKDVKYIMSSPVIPVVDGDRLFLPGGEIDEETEVPRRPPTLSTAEDAALKLVYMYMDDENVDGMLDEELNQLNENVTKAHIEYQNAGPKEIERFIPRSNLKRAVDAMMVALAGKRVEYFKKHIFDKWPQNPKKKLQKLGVTVLPSGGEGNYRMVKKIDKAEAKKLVFEEAVAKLAETMPNLAVERDGILINKQYSDYSHVERKLIDEEMERVRKKYNVREQTRKAVEDLPGKEGMSGGMELGDGNSDDSDFFPDEEESSSESDDSEESNSEDDSDDDDDEPEFEVRRRGRPPDAEADRGGPSRVPKRGNDDGDSNAPKRKKNALVGMKEREVWAKEKEKATEVGYEDGQVASLWTKNMEIWEPWLARDNRDEIGIKGVQRILRQLRSDLIFFYGNKGIEEAPSVHEGVTLFVQLQFALRYARNVRTCEEYATFAFKRAVTFCRGVQYALVPANMNSKAWNENSTIEIDGIMHTSFQAFSLSIYEIDVEYKKAVKALEQMLQEIKQDSPRPEKDEQEEDYANEKTIVAEVALSPTFNLFEWQARNVQRFKDQVKKGEGLLIADMPGLGKTLSAVACAISCAKSPTGDNGNSEFTTLVVCPASLTKQWAESIRTMTNANNVYMYEGTKANIDVVNNYGADWVIISYEKLKGLSPEDLEVFEDPTSFACVIFDEVHTQGILDPKNLGSGKHKPAYDICKKIANACLERRKSKTSPRNTGVVALSGTPVTHGLQDLVILAQLVGSKTYKEVQQFKDIQDGGPTGTKTHRVITDPKALNDPKLLPKDAWDDEIDFMTRTEVSKEAIGSQFPKLFVFEERPIISEHQSAIENPQIYNKSIKSRYREIVQRANLRTKTDGIMVLEQLNLLRKVCASVALSLSKKEIEVFDDQPRQPGEKKQARNNALYRRLSEKERLDNKGAWTGKMDTILRVVEEMLSDTYMRNEKTRWSAKYSGGVAQSPDGKAEGRKIIIFSDFTDVLYDIHVMISQKMNKQALLLTGKSEDNNEVIRSFKTDPSQDIILMHQLFGTGLDLQVATGIIFVEPQWLSATHEQCIARAWRMPEKKSGDLNPSTEPRDVVVSFILPTLKYSEDEPHNKEFRRNGTPTIETFMYARAEENRRSTLKIFRKMFPHNTPESEANTESLAIGQPNKLLQPLVKIYK